MLASMLSFHNVCGLNSIEPWLPLSEETEQLQSKCFRER
jgi:hypothetical protein